MTVDKDSACAFRQGAAPMFVVFCPLIKVLVVSRVKEFCAFTATAGVATGGSSVPELYLNQEMDQGQTLPA